MYLSLFIYSPIGIYLGCFKVLAIMNKTTVKVCVQVLWDIHFQCIGVNTKVNKDFVGLPLLLCYSFNNERDLWKLRPLDRM